MPRSGYDVSFTAQGSPASEAAARARQRTASSQAPRVGTPTNPSRQDEEDPEATPRASRIGVFARTAPANIQTGFQTGLIPQHMAGPELYQNPLYMNSARNASQSWMMPVNPQYVQFGLPGMQSTTFPRTAVRVPTSQGIGFINAQAPSQPIHSGAANSRVEQHHFQRSGGWSHAMPYGFPTSHNADPQLPSHGFHIQTGTGPSGNIDEDAEMRDTDNNQSYK
ncbi:hypothetical protein ACQKWADRAFT_304791 [Trichoderma austrokoningii]